MINQKNHKNKNHKVINMINGRHLNKKMKLYKNPVSNRNKRKKCRKYQKNHINNFQKNP